ncbi:MAG: metal ABC transporter permease, partial [Candidatus Brocadiales bacterium]|nr:metal ABC transporter permease [Candidatus Brocadiales bacterium]
MTAYLIVPAVNGLILANRMKNVFIIAVTTGIISALAGFYISFIFDFPTSP